jgi:uncharacterized protein involved in exopolysaccharide biosynthesis
MKRAMRAVAWLYPKRWRERYGDEFEALIEDSRGDWRALADVLKGALKMQFTHWGAGRIMTVAAIAGAVIAAAVSFAVPDRWESQAVIKLTPIRIPESVGQGEINQGIYDRLQSLEQSIESRAALTTIVNDFGLYPRERSRLPLEDIVEGMRRHIVIAPIANGNASRRSIPAFSVRFSYEDPLKAQRVTQELVSRFIEENLRQHLVPIDAGQRLEILDPPSLPLNPAGPKRVAFAGAGLLAGLTGGFVIAIVRRTRRNSSGICPTCGRPIAIVGPASAGEPVA